MLNIEWMGLWRSDRSGYYISKTITKKQLQEMPAKCRFVLRYNKYHHSGDNRPKFQLTYADIEAVDAMTCEIEEYSNEITRLHDRLNDLSSTIEMLVSDTYHLRDDDNQFYIANHARDASDELEDILASSIFECKRDRCIGMTP